MWWIVVFVHCGYVIKYFRSSRFVISLLTRVSSDGGFRLIFARAREPRDLERTRRDECRFIYICNRTNRALRYTSRCMHFERRGAYPHRTVCARVGRGQAGIMHRKLLRERHARSIISQRPDTCAKTLLGEGGRAWTWQRRVAEAERTLRMEGGGCSRRSWPEPTGPGARTSRVAGRSMRVAIATPTRWLAEPERGGVVAAARGGQRLQWRLCGAVRMLPTIVPHDLASGPQPRAVVPPRPSSTRLMASAGPRGRPLCAAASCAPAQAPPAARTSAAPTRALHPSKRR